MNYQEQKIPGRYNALGIDIEINIIDSYFSMRFQLIKSSYQAFKA